MAKTVVIVGGVAGGMSCAARIRRLDEKSTIIIYEKGPSVSFANCGMPYYVGGVIENRNAMIVQTAETLQARYNLQIHTRHLVEKILPDEKQVIVKNLISGETHVQTYDVLVLATGASPIIPDIPGSTKEHVCTLTTLDDMDRVREKALGAKRACIIGGGYIGLELAENLRNLGLEVILVELLEQILSPLDKEMTIPILQEIRCQGVSVHLGCRAVAVEDQQVRLSDGQSVAADLVCLCTGIKPRSELAQEAGIDVGPKGHIIVDEMMQTSRENIYAVGDVVQVNDRVTGESIAVPLAGPANRQGRIAADNICGRSSRYPGILGTSIVKVFNQVAGCTGWNEKRLKQSGNPYFRVYVHPMHHARYYPNAVPVSIKGLFNPEGRLIGAQVVGSEGVQTALDVLAVAVAHGMTAQDLEHLELAYAPQFDSAKSGINMLGFTAMNVIKGDVSLVEPDDSLSLQECFILDVRMPAEAECGVIPRATLIPLDQLRGRYSELPRDKTIAVYCAVGLRGYVAYRQLIQNGFSVKNINGGYRTWCWYNAASAAASGTSALVCKPCANLVETGENLPMPKNYTLDVCGLQCPGPITRVKQKIVEIEPGETLEVYATDIGFIADIPAWCQSTGNTLLEVRPEGNRYVARIQKGAATQPTPVVKSRQAIGRKSKTIVCFSDDLDRVMATFVIANGAAAMDSDVTIFFTFWGLNVLKKEQPPRVNKGLLDRMFGMMMPKGPRRLSLSKMHMGGVGSMMMRHVMKKKNVMAPHELIAAAQAAGIRLVACAMSMDVMGVKKEELIDGIEIGGVGAYLGAAEQAGVNLFI